MTRWYQCCRAAWLLHNSARCMRHVGMTNHMCPTANAFARKNGTFWVCRRIRRVLEMSSARWSHRVLTLSWKRDSSGRTKISQLHGSTCIRVKIHRLINWVNLLRSSLLSIEVMWKTHTWWAIFKNGRRANWLLLFRREHFEFVRRWRSLGNDWLAWSADIHAVQFTLRCVTFPSSWCSLAF